MKDPKTRARSIRWQEELTKEDINIDYIQKALNQSKT